MRLLFVVAAVLTLAQGRGQQIPAKDGDIVVTDIAAKIHVIRRAEGQTRVVYNPAQKSVIVLLDYTGPAQRPDGVVDASYFFRDVSSWPLTERWDGRATVAEYSTAGSPIAGIGLATPSGLIQLLTTLGPPRADVFKDPSAAAIVDFGAFGTGGPARLGFDAAEQMQVDRLNRPAPSGTAPTASYMTPAPPPAPRPRAPGEPGPPQAPVRVGGNVRQPVKTADAKPIMPADAQQAGIRGVVILEIVVGADGTVTSARVLRSILPSLDRAAIDAVKQWRYEPTQLNGQPVPVIMTVTVAFP
jgi:TonB family protein